MFQFGELSPQKPPRGDGIEARD